VSLTVVFLLHTVEVNFHRPPVDVIVVRLAFWWGAALLPIFIFSVNDIY
jgi:hypothetical protein